MIVSRSKGAHAQRSELVSAQALIMIRFVHITLLPKVWQAVGAWGCGGVNCWACGAVNWPVRSPASSRAQVASVSEVSGLLIEQFADAASGMLVRDRLVVAAGHSKRTMIRAADPRARPGPIAVTGHLAPVRILSCKE